MKRFLWVSVACMACLLGTLLIQPCVAADSSSMEFPQENQIGQLLNVNEKFESFKSGQHHDSILSKEQSAEEKSGYLKKHPLKKIFSKDQKKEELPQTKFDTQEAIDYSISDSSQQLKSAHPVQKLKAHWLSTSAYEGNHLKSDLWLWDANSKYQQALEKANSANMAKTVKQSDAERTNSAVNNAGHLRGPFPPFGPFPVNPIPIIPINPVPIPPVPFNPFGPVPFIPVPVNPYYPPYYPPDYPPYSPVPNNNSTNDNSTVVDDTDAPDTGAYDDATSSTEIVAYYYDSATGVNYTFPASAILKISVGAKQATNPQYTQGNTNAFFLNGIEQPVLHLAAPGVYLLRRSTTASFWNLKDASSNDSTSSDNSSTTTSTHAGWPFVVRIGNTDNFNNNANGNTWNLTPQIDDNDEMIWKVELPQSITDVLQGKTAANANQLPAIDVQAGTVTLYYTSANNQTFVGNQIVIHTQS